MIINYEQQVQSMPGRAGVLQQVVEKGSWRDHDEEMVMLNSYERDQQRLDTQMAAAGFQPSGNFLLTPTVESASSAKANHTYTDLKKLTNQKFLAGPDHHHTQSVQKNSKIIKRK